MMGARSLRWTAILFVAVLSLSLMGCGGSKINKANFDKINNGMTEAEVEAILGKGEEKGSVGVGAPGIAVNLPGGANVGFPGIALPSLKAKSWQEGSKTIGITFMDGKVMGKVQTGL